MSDTVIPKAFVINRTGLVVFTFLALLCFGLAVSIRRGGRLPGGWHARPPADAVAARRFLSSFLTIAAIGLLAVPWIIQCLPWKTAAIVLVTAGGFALAAAGLGVLRHGSRTTD